MAIFECLSPLAKADALGIKFCIKLTASVRVPLSFSSKIDQQTLTNSVVELKWP